MNFDNLLSFLFQDPDCKPQLGFAGKDKRAWLWLPGRKPLGDVKRIIDTAPLRGCTQLSFQSYSKLSDRQPCWIHWVGLDIDHDDNPGIDLVQVATNLCKTPISMLRTSLSGKGIHVIYRLEKPIQCANSHVAGRYVASIARPMKEEFESAGIHVCQANRRMFWLDGGKNREVFRAEHCLVSPETNDVTPTPLMPNPDKEVSPRVLSWIAIFQAHKVLSSWSMGGNRIYVGDAIAALREWGEKVYTKSGCSGNGHINGYLDITPNKISLWTYADGHIVWNYTDLESMMEAR